MRFCTYSGLIAQILIDDNFGEVTDKAAVAKVQFPGLECEFVSGSRAGHCNYVKGGEHYWTEVKNWINELH